MFFFCQGFLLQTHWQLTGQQGKWGDHLLFHSTTSTRSRIFRHLFCNFAREVTHIFLIAPVLFTRLILDEITTLSHYYLIDRWCDIDFCLFICWFDSKFLLQLLDTGNRWSRTRIDYQFCITSKPTNQVY